MKAVQFSTESYCVLLPVHKIMMPLQYACMFCAWAWARASVALGVMSAL